MSTNQSIDKIIRVYYVVILFVVIVFFALIFGKACITSIFYGKNWRDIGIKQIYSNNVKLQPKRGNIYSSKYELMALSEMRYRLLIDFYAKGIKIDTLKKYVGTISIKLNKMFPQKSADQYKIHIIKGWNIRSKKNRRYLLLDHDVNYVQLKKIKSMPYFNQGRNKSGLYYKILLKRVNPYGTLALRTIGSVYGELGKGGKNGLEKYYNDFLSGKSGIVMIKKIRGKFVNIPKVKPVPAKDIVTTIDVKLQDIVEEKLLDNLKKFKAESGTAVLMEVATGEVKAITNMKYVGENNWKEAKNYAVSDLCEPGSTFKVVSMMVAIEDGVVNPGDTVDTEHGKVMIHGKVLRDHNADRGGYGKITAAQSVCYSSNIGIARLIEKGYGKNPEKYVDAIYKIGLNKEMKLEIPGYGIPNIRHPKIKKSASEYWANTTLSWMSFGYGIQIPPIYILTFFNAIANNGKLVKPVFVKEIRSRGKIVNKKHTQIINNKICSQSTLIAIRQMLDDAVNKSGGTGIPAHSDEIRIAGKTGTIQLSQGIVGYNSKKKSYQVSFCGYFPVEKPLYSCIVVICKPHKGYPSGGGMCGTVLKNIAEKIYERKIVYGIKLLSVDTVHSLLPVLKTGRSECTVRILKELKISNTNIKKLIQSSISATKKDSNAVFFKNKKNFLIKIPNVIGMGAKDAVFALESIGLKVNLFGSGTVVTQSILSKKDYKNGQLIVLHLK